MKFLVNHLKTGVHPPVALQFDIYGRDYVPPLKTSWFGADYATT